MRFSHINLPIPQAGEEIVRAFYCDLIGLPEIPKPPELAARGGCWFDAGGIDIHLSVSSDPPGEQRHFGLEVTDLEELKKRLNQRGIEIDPGRPAPWPRFFAHDPFGNRIEFHEPGGLGG